MCCCAVLGFLSESLLSVQFNSFSHVASDQLTYSYLISSHILSTLLNSTQLYFLPLQSALLWTAHQLLMHLHYPHLNLLLHYSNHPCMAPLPFSFFSFSPFHILDFSQLKIIPYQKIHSIK